MKQKFRLLKRSIVFCALAFLSCQDDLPDQIGNDTHAHSKHTYLDFEKFSQQFPETASKVRSQNDKANDHLQRGIYDPENDFTIETDKIFMGENEGGTYLTFAVNRESTSFEGIENLVLKSDNQGGYIPMLTKYDISAEEKNGLLSGVEISNLESKFSVEMLENVNFGQDLPIAGKFECASFMVGYCEYGIISHGGGYEDNETRCRGYKEKYITACGDSDGGGSSGGGSMGGGSSSPSTPNTGNSPGQSGGGGGNPGTGTYNPNGPSIPVITTPIPVVVVEDNCAQLKDMMKTPKTQLPPLAQSIPLAIQGLNNKLTSSVEHGAALKLYGSVGNFAFSVPPGKSDHIHFPPSPTMFGTIHTHPDDNIAVPMFSTDDIFSLMTVKDGFGATIPNAAGNSLFVNVMVTSQGTYSIKINDIVKFQALSAIYNTDKLKKKFKRNLEKRYNEADRVSGGVPIGTAIGYQKDFLNFITNQDTNGYDLGISLYMLESDPAFPAKKTWNELTLSANGQTVNKTPCN